MAWRIITKPDMNMRRTLHTYFVAFAACAIWVLSGIAAPPPAHNMVANSGFETHSTGGAAQGWHYDPRVYSIVSESPHAGSFCLRYENRDAKRYRLCTRAIKLEPGRMYELSAWVRTESIRGAESGAGLCIEWNSADGHWLGGSYPTWVRGTQRAWTRVRGITGVIPENAAKFSVSCYVRKGMTGIAWWDDVAVRPYYPPMIQAIVTDRYRNVTAGGPLRVDVGLALETYRLPTAKWNVTLAALRADGTCIEQISTHPGSLTQAHFELDSSPWKAGTYQLRCHVESVGGEYRADAKCRLRRVARMPRWKTRIDTHGRVILDGKPFFPLGMYWGGVQQKELDIYARSPFNCIMPYRNIDRAALDRAEKAGIKVIYSVKNYYAGMSWSPSSVKNRADEHRVIAETVKRLKDHPAIMAWYINDELPLTMLESLTAHRDWLEQLDPSRPTWVVLYQVDQVRGYIPTFDVIGTDPYPVPDRPIDMPLQWTRKTRSAVFGHRSVWMVPQVFNWASYKKHAAEKAKCRAPTLQEMRCMAWQCIAGGGNGLVFYSWLDLWRMDKTDPFQQRWKDVTKMAGEIKQWTPILLSIDPAPKFGRVEVPDTVGWRLFAKDGATYLLAVNASQEPATARWKSPIVLHDARQLLESKQPAGMRPDSDAPSPGSSNVQLEGQTIRLRLAPLAVAFVRLKP